MEIDTGMVAGGAMEVEPEAVPTPTTAATTTTTAATAVVAAAGVGVGVGVATCSLFTVRSLGELLAQGSALREIEKANGEDEDTDMLDDSDFERFRTRCEEMLDAISGSGGGASTTAELKKFSEKHWNELGRSRDLYTSSTTAYLRMVLACAMHATTTTARSKKNEAMNAKLFNLAFHQCAQLLEKGGWPKPSVRMYRRSLEVVQRVKVQRDALSELSWNEMDDMFRYALQAIKRQCILMVAADGNGDGSSSADDDDGLLQTLLFAQECMAFIPQQQRRRRGGSKQTKSSLQLDEPLRDPAVIVAELFHVHGERFSRIGKYPEANLLLERAQNILELKSNEEEVGMGGDGDDGGGDGGSTAAAAAAAAAPALRALRNDVLHSRAVALARSGDTAKADRLSQQLAEYASSGNSSSSSTSLILKLEIHFAAGAWEEYFAALDRAMPELVGSGHLDTVMRYAMGCCEKRGFDAVSVGKWRTLIKLTKRHEQQPVSGGGDAVVVGRGGASTKLQLGLLRALFAHIRRLGSGSGGTTSGSSANAAAAAAAGVASEVFTSLVDDHKAAGSSSPDDNDTTAVGVVLDELANALYSMCHFWWQLEQTNSADVSEDAPSALCFEWAQRLSTLVHLRDGDGEPAPISSSAAACRFPTRAQVDLLSVEALGLLGRHREAVELAADAYRRESSPTLAVVKLQHVLRGGFASEEINAHLDDVIALDAAADAKELRGRTRTERLRVVLGHIWSAADMVRNSSQGHSIEAQQGMARALQRCIDIHQQVVQQQAAGGGASAAAADSRPADGQQPDVPLFAVVFELTQLLAKQIEFAHSGSNGSAAAGNGNSTEALYDHFLATLQFAEASLHKQREQFGLSPQSATTMAKIAFNVACGIGGAGGGGGDEHAVSRVPYATAARVFQAAYGIGVAAGFTDQDSCETLILAGQSWLSETDNILEFDDCDGGGGGGDGADGGGALVHAAQEARKCIDTAFARGKGVLSRAPMVTLEVMLFKTRCLTCDASLNDVDCELLMSIPSMEGIWDMSNWARKAGKNALANRICEIGVQRCTRAQPVECVHLAEFLMDIIDYADSRAMILETLQSVHQVHLANVAPASAWRNKDLEGFFAAAWNHGQFYHDLEQWKMAEKFFGTALEILPFVDGYKDQQESYREFYEQVVQVQRDEWTSL